MKQRLGIDYKALRKINQRIIYASISGFGQAGPYARASGLRPDRAGHGRADVDHRPAGAGTGARRHPDRRPVAPDCSARIGILTALLEREKSGKGQQVETSLLQAQIFMLDFQAARWLIAGEVPGQAGNNHPTSIPTGVFKTSDGYINIATTGQKMWERLCEALGAPELVEAAGIRERPERARRTATRSTPRSTR